MNIFFLKKTTNIHEQTAVSWGLTIVSHLGSLIKTSDSYYFGPFRVIGYEKSVIAWGVEIRANIKRVFTRNMGKTDEKNLKTQKNIRCANNLLSGKVNTFPILSKQWNKTKGKCLRFSGKNQSTRSLSHNKKYSGTAQVICNLNTRHLFLIFSPIEVHNLSSYDAHSFYTELFKQKRILRNFTVSLKLLKSILQLLKVAFRFID